MFVRKSHPFSVIYVFVCLLLLFRLLAQLKSWVSLRVLPLCDEIRVYVLISFHLFYSFTSAAAAATAATAASLSFLG